MTLSYKTEIIISIIITNYVVNSLFVRRYLLLIMYTVPALLWRHHKHVYWASILLGPPWNRTWIIAFTKCALPSRLNSASKCIINILSIIIVYQVSITYSWIVFSTYYIFLLFPSIFTYRFVLSLFLFEWEFLFSSLSVIW